MREGTGSELRWHYEYQMKVGLKTCCFFNNEKKKMFEKIPHPLHLG